MKRKLVLGIAICLLLLGGVTAWRALATTAPDAPLALTSWRVSSGGGSLNGGTFALNGTGGQPEAGVLAEGTYHLQEGFWRPIATDDTIYLPLVRRP